MSGVECRREEDGGGVLLKGWRGAKDVTSAMSLMKHARKRRSFASSEFIMIMLLLCEEMREKRRNSLNLMTKSNYFPKLNVWVSCAPHKWFNLQKGFD